MDEGDFHLLLKNYLRWFSFKSQINWPFCWSAHEILNSTSRTVYRIRRCRRSIWRKTVQSSKTSELSKSNSWSQQIICHNLVLSKSLWHRDCTGRFGDYVVSALSNTSRGKINPPVGSRHWWSSTDDPETKAAEADEMMKPLNQWRKGADGEMERRAEQEREHTNGRETFKKGAAAKWSADNGGVSDGWDETGWWEQLMSRVTAPDTNSRKLWASMGEDCMWGWHEK